MMSFPQLRPLILDRFSGIASDATGRELAPQQFTDLLNFRVSDGTALELRPGAAKVFSQTDAGGSAVRGLHTYIDAAGGKTYLKAANAQLRKSTAGAWSQVGATTFTDADTFFATLQTRKTGASADATGTSTSADATSVTNTGASMTVNAHVGKVLVVNGETKLITANDANTIFVAERFDSTATALTGVTYNIYARQPEVFLCNGTDFYKTDATTNTRLDNTTHAGYAFRQVTTHAKRLFGIVGTRLMWSDTGVGEHFSRNAFKEFGTAPTAIATLGEVMVIYEREKITVMTGDNPDNFRFREVLTGVGTVAPKSIANHGSYQFVLTEQQGVVYLTTDSAASQRNTETVLSISRGYVQDSIAAASAAQRANAAGGVKGDHYHLTVHQTTYVLNVKETLMSGFRRVCWTRDTRPSGLHPNCYGDFDGRFVIGSQSTGQVYEIETGTDDDGTAIAGTIEKQDWIVGGYRSRPTIASIVTSQAVGGTGTMSYFAAQGGSSYGSAISSINLATATSPDHTIPVPGNPSAPQNLGTVFSFKITVSTSASLAKIEKLGVLFYPGLLE